MNTFEVLNKSFNTVFAFKINNNVHTVLLTKHKNYFRVRLTSYRLKHFTL